MWDMKCMIIPVIIGDNGRVTNFKETFESLTTKTSNRFTTKDSCTRNIAHNAEITTV